MAGNLPPFKGSPGKGLACLFNLPGPIHYIRLRADPYVELGMTEVQPNSTREYAFLTDARYMYIHLVPAWTAPATVLAQTPLVAVLD